MSCCSCSKIPVNVVKDLCDKAHVHYSKLRDERVEQEIKGAMGYMNLFRGMFSWLGVKPLTREQVIGRLEADKSIGGITGARGGFEFRWARSLYRERFEVIANLRKLADLAADGVVVVSSEDMEVLSPEVS